MPAKRCEVERMTVGVRQLEIRCGRGRERMAAALRAERPQTMSRVVHQRAAERCGDGAERDRTGVARDEGHAAILAAEALWS